VVWLVRERQHRYLQAAHRAVYQTFEEDILPFPELYEQRSEHADSISAPGTRHWPYKTGVTPAEEEDEEEEEEDEEEEEEDEEEGTEEEEEEESEDNSEDEDNEHELRDLSDTSI